jgi:NAD(P)-dependent dehydrogenase (short-subunit alcohol dehydrogenase family)
MRILVVGATGTIGRAVVAALQGQHEILAAARKDTPLRVDITDRDSIRAMYRDLGRVDAVVSAAGESKWAPLSKLSDDDFAVSLRNKLMGQVDLVRLGFDHVQDGGSFTITSGTLSRHPAPGSAAITMVNCALEGFARAAALEAPRGIRVNAVSPPWVTDTLVQFGMDPSTGWTPERVASLYVRAVTGTASGAILEPDDRP